MLHDLLLYAERKNSACKVVEVLCLEYYLTGTYQLCEEKSLAAEEYISQSLYSLYLVLYSGLECNYVACVYFEYLAWSEVFLYHISVNFEESHAVSEELLENESLTAEESREYLLCENCLEVYCLFSAEKSALLADKTAVGYIYRNERTGDCSAESYLCALNFCCVISHEYGFACEHSSEASSKTASCICAHLDAL